MSRPLADPLFPWQAGHLGKGEAIWHKVPSLEVADEVAPVMLKGKWVAQESTQEPF